MIDRPRNGATSTPTKVRWRLWHPMSLVLASAILLGSIHAMGRGHPFGFGALLTVCLIVTIMIIVGSNFLGMKLGERLAETIARRGRCRGGSSEALAGGFGVLAWFFLGLAGTFFGLAVSPVGIFLIAAHFRP